MAEACAQIPDLALRFRSSIDGGLNQFWAAGIDLAFC